MEQVEHFDTFIVIKNLSGKYLMESYGQGFVILVVMINNLLKYFPWHYIVFCLLQLKLQSVLFIVCPQL